LDSATSSIVARSFPTHCVRWATPSYVASCNRCYLEFLSALRDHTAGERDLVKLTRSTRLGHRTIKDLYFFERSQQALPRALDLTEQVIRFSCCYLTRLCRAAIAADCSLTQLKIVPAMALAR
jgi:hypothetical protein